MDSFGYKIEPHIVLLTTLSACTISFKVNLVKLLWEYPSQSAPAAPVPAVDATGLALAAMVAPGPALRPCTVTYPQPLFGPSRSH